MIFEHPLAIVDEFEYCRKGKPNLKIQPIVQNIKGIKNKLMVLIG
jgi:hypothetical protein